MKSFSKRRKIVEQIPSDTFYCYKPITDIIREEGKLPYFKTKTCPYFKFITSLEGKCKLYKCEILDQVKSCGLRDGKF